MKVHAIVNARAGAALDFGGEDACRQIETAFRAAGHDVTAELAQPDALVSAIERARDRGCDLLLVGGGDGTVRAAAVALIGTDIRLGILPLGTLNRLARDLKIPLDLSAAISALSQGETARIDVGEVNGRVFLCNSVFGLPATFAARRQSLRGQPAWQRLKGYAGALRDFLRSRRRVSVNVDNGHSRLRLPVLSMAVSNNRYIEKPSLMLEKDGLQHGVLAVYISRHPSGWAMARSVLRAMAGHFKSDPDLIHVEGHTITVDTRRRLLRLSNDGELDVVETPLTYKIHPRALNVLIPART